MPDESRLSVALLDQGVDARATHLDQRKFGRDEEPVQYHEEQGRAESPGDPQRIQLGMGFVHRYAPTL